MQPALPHNIAQKEAVRPPVSRQSHTPDPSMREK